MNHHPIIGASPMAVYQIRLFHGMFHGNQVRTHTRPLSSVLSSFSAPPSANQLLLSFRSRIRKRGHAYQGCHHEQDLYNEHQRGSERSGGACHAMAPNGTSWEGGAAHGGERREVDAQTRATLGSSALGASPLESSAQFGRGKDTRAERDLPR